MSHFMTPGDRISSTAIILPAVPSANSTAMIQALIELVTCRNAARNGSLTMSHLKKFGGSIKRAGGLQEFQRVSMTASERGLSLPELEAFVELAEITNPKQQRAVYLEFCEILNIPNGKPGTLPKSKRMRPTNRDRNGRGLIM